MTDRRIYVANLAAYNAGRLEGGWVELEDMSDADDLGEAMQAFATPTGEEVAIHDHEGFPKGTIGEFSSAEEVWEIHALCEEHGGAAEVALANFRDVEQAREACEEYYQGEHNSLEDWAEEFHADMGSDLGALASYIDWERLARDAELGGDIWSARDSDGSLHVFWSR